MLSDLDMSDTKESGRRLRVRERRRYTEEYGDEEIGYFDGRAFDVEEKLKSERFNLTGDYVKDMSGDELKLSYFQENGFERPILIKQMTGLGMKMPPKTFNVWDVKSCVGSRRVLDVMDVETQRDFHMTMKEWCTYYNSPERDRLLNVISLEFSHTKLESFVDSPSIVKMADWIDWVWPKHLKDQQTDGTNNIEDMKYPKVQKYCLMSVKGCYTDFHIDFGGTSVWYHILKGKKVFWLIPPSERNIQLYEQWVLSGKQSDVFFGDTVDICGRILLSEGHTFFIPTGWIHAVYTPDDSLVFGGNFLHSFGIEKQLRVAQVEDITKVPSKFRYPFYTEVLWYVLARYVNCLMGKNHLNCCDDGTSIVASQCDNNDHSTVNGKLTNGSSSSSLPECSHSKPHKHLTPFELNGLKAIIMWLSRLPPSKRSLPELIINAEALLNDAKVLIDEHSRDVHQLAITGVPVLYWSNGDKPKQQISSSPLSITSQLRQIKHHNSNKNKNILSNCKDEVSSGSSTVSNGGVPRPESPPTRPLSSNQYRISLGTTITQQEIPSSFAGLIASTGVGTINGGFVPSSPISSIIIPSMTSLSTPALPSVAPSQPEQSTGLPPPPPLVSVPSNAGNYSSLSVSSVSVKNNQTLEHDVPLSTNTVSDVTKYFQTNGNIKHLPENSMITKSVTADSNQMIIDHNQNYHIKPMHLSANVSVTTNTTAVQFQGFASAFMNTSTVSNYVDLKHSPVAQHEHVRYLPTALPPSGFHPPADKMTHCDGIKMVNCSTSTSSPGTKTSTGTSTTTKSSANDSSRRRRTRCKKCDSCLRADCGECHFCKDMKKFGGPGRMKQSCIARQCMAPVLPHTACCMICGRDGWEKLTITEQQTLGDDTASSLMECSQCWEIVHPFCLGEKYASLPHSGGNINIDLPNSWECPRCVRLGPPSGKPSASITGLNAKAKPNKSFSSCPNWAQSLSFAPSISTSTSTSPLPLIMTKTDDNSIPLPNKRMKIDDESPPSTEDEDNGDNDTPNKDNYDTDDDNGRDSPSPPKSSNANSNTLSHVRSCARFPHLSQGLMKTHSLSLHSPQSSPQSTIKTAKNGVFGKSEVKGLASLAMSSKKKSETSRDRLFKSIKGLKKSSEMTSRCATSAQMQMVKKAAAKLHRETSSGSSSSVGSPSYVQSSAPYLTSPSSNGASTPLSIKPEMFNETQLQTVIDDESTEDEDDDQISHMMVDDDKERDEKKSDNENLLVNRIEKELKKPKFVVRPAPLEEDVSDTEIEDFNTDEDDDDDDSTTDEENDNRKLKRERQKAKKCHLKKFRLKRSQNNLAIERDAILPVLPYLSRCDLLRCMTVCKLWNRWCCDPALWKHLDLTRKRITSLALIGIVRRQPQQLNLSWTNISKRQLVWLIARLPQLVSLSLSGCSSVSVTALSSCNCPLLRHLDLSWCEGINDDIIRHLLSAPLDSRPGVMETKTRLRYLTTISVAGSDISDVSIRLMTHHLTTLSSIDLSHCHKVTDMGIAVLGAAKSSKLTSLNLSSCSNISDTSLDALRRCSLLTMLDTRECPQVSIGACNKFIVTCSSASTYKLIMKQPKLIEAIK